MKFEEIDDEENISDCLIRTRVVLKSQKVWKQDITTAFNKNKGCIEMLLFSCCSLVVQCLIRTRVVLKW